MVGRSAVVMIATGPSAAMSVTKVVSPRRRSLMVACAACWLSTTTATGIGVVAGAGAGAGKVAVFQLLEHVPGLVGLQHLGVAGGAAFCPEGEVARFGGNLRPEISRLQINELAQRFAFQLDEVLPLGIGIAKGNELPDQVARKGIGSRQGLFQ